MRGWTWISTRLARNADSSKGINPRDYQIDGWIITIIVRTCFLNGRLLTMQVRRSGWFSIV
jgi:hypothetical protein